LPEVDGIGLILAMVAGIRQLPPESTNFSRNLVTLPDSGRPNPSQTSRNLTSTSESDQYSHISIVLSRFW